MLYSNTLHIKDELKIQALQPIYECEDGMLVILNSEKEKFKRLK
jgi:hypothetical protein